MTRLQRLKCILGLSSLLESDLTLALRSPLVRFQSGIIYQFAILANASSSSFRLV